MAGEMSFNDGTDEFSTQRPQEAGFDLTGKLIAWGLVKTRDEAQYVMIGVAAVAILLAGYFFMSGGSHLPPPPPVQ